MGLPNRCSTVAPPETTGSIEDKILELQDRKRDMISNALEGRGGVAKNFTREEIVDLFDVL